LNFPNGPDGFGEHVSRIVTTKMLAAYGERLAWWPATDKVNLACVLRKIVIPNVPLDNFPIADMLYAVALVATKRLTRVSIPIEHRPVVEASPSGSQRKPASPSEQFKRPQSGSRNIHVFSTGATNLGFFPGTKKARHSLCLPVRC
jgi:hypothetical protein